MTDSQRDVVFTPFMLRVRAEFEGGDVLVPLRVRSSELRSVAQANDDWVAQRARAEQVVAEANAMRNGHAPLIDLVDQIGADHLGFALTVGGRTAAVVMHLTGRTAWVELERSYVRSDGPVELADLQALEDLVIELAGQGG
ncbi:MAG: hypothetical protein AB7J32_17115 [Pseudonocardia sp.]